MSRPRDILPNSSEAELRRVEAMIRKREELDDLIDDELLAMAGKYGLNAVSRGLAPRLGLSHFAMQKRITRLRAATGPAMHHQEAA